RRNVKLAECPSYGQSIFEYAPRSNGATDYLALADEVLALLDGRSEPEKQMAFSKNDASAAQTAQESSTGQSVSMPVVPAAPSAPPKRIAPSPAGGESLVVVQATSVVEAAAVVGSSIE
ncbi:MAG TPA: hypothetical protein VNT79_06740, partial [Phycisphaerae bacterium]|nr:hypothetical protein [Phycisphaerae bacterium]